MPTPSNRLEIVSQNDVVLASAPIGAGVAPGALAKIGDETEEYFFRIFMPLPWCDFELYIGDVRIEVDLDRYPGHADSKGDSYFESCVDEARVDLWGCPAPAAPRRHLAAIPVFVEPSKLGRARYEGLIRDISLVSQSLVFDFAGKAKRKIEFLAQASSSGVLPWNVEWSFLQEQIWTPLEGALGGILRNPLSGMRRVRSLGFCSESTRLDNTAIERLAEQGIDPRHLDISHGCKAFVPRAGESYDIPEHRIIRLFLLRLLDRLFRFDKVLANQVEELQSERLPRLPGAGVRRRLRDRQQKLDRLDRIRKRAGEMRQSIHRVLTRSFLRSAPAAGEAVLTPAFRFVPAYQRLWTILSRYFEYPEWSLETGSLHAIKQTWALYEQWVFLQLVYAFRLIPELRQVGDFSILQRGTRDTYLYNLARNTKASFLHDGGFEIRLRYQPWVHPVKDAEILGEGICVIGRNQAFDPDILVEFRQPDQPNVRIPTVFYVVALDAKYTGADPESKRNEVNKYHFIASTSGHHSMQIAKEVWIVHPKDDLVDPNSEFWGKRPPDDYDVSGALIPGYLGMRPPLAGADAAAIRREIRPVQAAAEFARRLLEYVPHLKMLREISSSNTRLRG
jgi:hypothetical protein